MSTNEHTAFRIHRFQNLVAVKIGKEPTKYLTAKQAISAGHALVRYGIDVKKFVKSRIGTVKYDQDGKKVK